MKGNEKLLTGLNSLLVDEHNAINQLVATPTNFQTLFNLTKGNNSNFKL